MSTPTDLVRFAETLFGGKLISEGSLKEMMPEGMGMGNGLFAIPFEEKRALGHNGGIDSFQSNLVYFPEDDLAVSMITNGIDYQMYNLLIGVLSLAFDQPYKLPEERLHLPVKLGADVCFGPLLCSLGRHHHQESGHETILEMLPPNHVFEGLGGNRSSNRNCGVGDEDRLLALPIAFNGPGAVHR